MLPVTIVMTVFFKNKQRKEVAENALATWNLNLMYEGDIYLHVADDGSTINWQPRWRNMITFSRQERKGVGASLNAGFKKAYQQSPLVLYMVDDWVLDEPLDITPWCKALLENDDIGMMRLGPPHPFLKGKVEMVTDDWQGWALKLERSGIVVAQRPALWHMRMTDCYGWFPENMSAVECERIYSYNFSNRPQGPEVYLALPHKWIHRESESLSEMEPGR